MRTTTLTASETTTFTDMFDQDSIGLEEKEKEKKHPRRPGGVQRGELGDITRGQKPGGVMSALIPPGWCHGLMFYFDSTRFLLGVDVVKIVRRGSM